MTSINIVMTNKAVDTASEAKLNFKNFIIIPFVFIGLILIPY